MGDSMKQRTKTILILIFVFTLINIDIHSAFVDLPEVQESVHLETARGHASDVCRTVHASVPVRYIEVFICESIIYSAIAKFIFENTQILTYLWQFPRANI